MSFDSIRWAKGKFLAGRSLFAFGKSTLVCLIEEHCLTTLYSIVKQAMDMQFSFLQPWVEWKTILNSPINTVLSHSQSLPLHYHILTAGSLPAIRIQWSFLAAIATVSDRTRKTQQAGCTDRATS